VCWYKMLEQAKICSDNAQKIFQVCHEYDSV